MIHSVGHVGVCPLSLNLHVCIFLGGVAISQKFKTPLQWQQHEIQLAQDTIYWTNVWGKVRSAGQYPRTSPAMPCIFEVIQSRRPLYMTCSQIAARPVKLILIRCLYQPSAWAAAALRTAGYPYGTRLLQN